MGGVPDLLGRLLADAALGALGVAIDIVFRPEIAVRERIAEVTELRCEPLGGGADCLADRLGEPLVPSPPECGLIGDRIEAELRDEKRILAEIAVERGFVAPTVQTAEDVRPKDTTEVDRVPFGVIVLVEQSEASRDFQGSNDLKQCLVMTTVADNPLETEVVNVLVPVTRAVHEVDGAFVGIAVGSGKITGHRVGVVAFVGPLDTVDVVLEPD